MEDNGTKFCCIVCNKHYTKKSSLDKHKILCDFKLKTQREKQIEVEELGDTPTHDQLVKIVQELLLKQMKMDEKMEQMQKWIDRKNKKINIISWLNTNAIPTIGFLEWTHTGLIINQSHFEKLMDDSLFNTIQQVFEDNLCEKHDFIYPIKCFSQKTSVFYICEKKEDGTPEWRQLVLEDMVLILKIVQNNMIKELSKWKNENQHKFDDNSKLSVIFNKSVIKLMNISFTQDNTLAKIKTNLYNYLKIDLKMVDF